MEALLDAADALVASSPQPERPDFSLPEDYAALETPPLLHLTETSHALGWVASSDIAMGTLLMVAKPIAMVMDWQDDSAPTQPIIDGDDDEMEEEKEPRTNELLLLQILQRLKTEPLSWENCLTKLFPRNKDLATLPAWVCADDEVFFEVESHLQALRNMPSLQANANDIAKRLPLIIRYNILSVETCPELLSFPGPHGHASLSGVALYHHPSFFNHSSRPNCSRYAIGDVMFLYSNQDISKGTEACISYIEHDVLCESAYRRNQLLNMNFVDCRHDEHLEPSPEENDGPDMPVIDSVVQNELMTMDPLERLQAMDELMQQAMGAKPPPRDEMVGEPHAMEESSMWFQCDVQNLRILKAITLESLAQGQQALDLWEEAIAFVLHNMPPNDENAIVLYVQAALCAHHRHELAKAQHYAAAALNIHQIVFGGGMERFRRRYRQELELKLRPSELDNGVDSLWPPN